MASGADPVADAQASGRRGGQAQGRSGRRPGQGRGPIAGHRFEATAPAKINLFLHVGRPGADGYHDLSSLMVFADVGDVVALEAGGSGFCVTGPFAAGLKGDDNLVTRARDLFLERFGGRERPIGLVLDKRLPIASGLGGGSADAAATLRLLAEAWKLPPSDRSESGALGDLARRLGADVAACLASTAVLATGRGDRLSPAPILTPLDLVLVNPLVPSPTGAVYGALDQSVAWGSLAWPDAPGLTTAADVVDWLRRTRNDLQGPAIGLTPDIGQVVARLNAAPECLLARMSGSGATCFAICPDRAAAERLTSRIEADRPAWWAKPCRIASWSDKL